MKFSFKEFHLFLLAILVFTLPLIFSGGVHTIDGSAHVYNANIIQNLIFGDGFFSSYFEFNSYPVPNWGGHFLLIFLNLFLNDFYSNQLIIFSLIIGLPVGFRYFLSSFEASSYKLYSYLSIPLGFSSMVLLGFYNFILGIVLCFLVVGLWNRLKNELSFKHILIFNALFCFVFFSHAFAFIFMGVLLLFLSINNKKTLLNLALSFALPSLFFLIYFINKDNGSPEFLSKKELIKWLLELKTIVLYSSKEVFQTSLISLSFLLLFFINIVFKVVSLVKSESKFGFRFEDFWLLFFFLIFLFAPNSDGFGSYISDRLLLLLMLVLIFWFSFKKFNCSIIPLVFTVLIYAQSCVLNYNRTSDMRYQNEQVNEIAEIASFINDKSIVFPLKSHSNHLIGHFSNYIAFDKEVLILENYEARQGYFPLKWNWKKLPKFMLGDKEIKIDNYSTLNHDEKIIDYVVIYTENLKDVLGNHSEIALQLEANYSIVHQTDNLVLFGVN